MSFLRCFKPSPPKPEPKQIEKKDIKIIDNKDRYLTSIGSTPNPNQDLNPISNPLFISKPSAPSKEIFYENQHEDLNGTNIYDEIKITVPDNQTYIN